ncbi:cupin domain-containing protein [Ancylobacter dichloromethanicus]|uniref:Cupin n=1 Tax=Ancylobacter dichloromethanicus TaxID=518825 RepID=A0A9W6J4R3_9HYPH|nr:cupin domain-containing protein [Ancylobacter dichloromethanicus]MBS7555598.1 cupin domain-containing protein [Ancylobacter dichloromethanicus]GLK70801.1 cupin [Ancylobacter dichloromethanicus]
MRLDGLSAQDVIAFLALAPHPEGGHFRETFRDVRRSAEGRSVSTAIYYLLAAGEVSHWHRVDAAEIWHWYGGAPLELRIARDSAGPVVPHILGPGVGAGEEPQRIVPRDAWQSARSLGGWTLIGCTVAPAFEFAGFELAPPGWSPG